MSTLTSHEYHNFYILSTKANKSEKAPKCSLHRGWSCFIDTKIQKKFNNYKIIKNIVTLENNNLWHWNNLAINWLGGQFYNLFFKQTVKQLVLASQTARFADCYLRYNIVNYISSQPRFCEAVISIFHYCLTFHGLNYWSVN